MRAASDEKVRRSRGDLVRALGIAWLANTALGTLVGSAYFGDALEGAPFFARLFAAAALLSSVATLMALALLLLVLAALLRPRAAFLGWLQACVWTAALLGLLVDTRIYGIFRYHLNGMVWNLITTPGGQDNFEIPARTWAVVLIAAIAVLVLERMLWTRLVAPDGPRRVRARVLGIGTALVLLVVVSEKLAYAVADARGNRQVTARAALFPLYQRLTMKRTLGRLMDVVERPRSVELARPGLLLRYPIRSPVLAPDGPRPNILIIVIDSLRADMLAPETMPKIHAWSRGARVFEDHLSGGNATRFGIFSLVYGIHGTYWMPVYEERTPPVLVTTLRDAGYDLRVISAARMSYPEFRSTAWVTIPDRVEDDFQGDKVARDRAVVARFRQWMAQRAAEQDETPYFCFVLLDAPHQTYVWPPEETVFQPAVTNLDYLELSSRPSDATIRTLQNSFRNAVHFADENAWEIIRAALGPDDAGNTVVIVTGDHGEEFFENGYFGHTSNFTPEQTHVTFVMSGPKVESGVETRPTCHVDVVPTLLEMLGADPSTRADWSQGESLLAPPDRRERVIAGWQEVAVQVDGGILHVPLEGHKGFVTARDRRWRTLDDVEAFQAAHSLAVADLARACRRFLR